MIDELIFRSGVSCRGGFIAYYNDMALYSPDPAEMFRRSVAILVCADGRLLICLADMTKPDVIPEHPAFRRISRAEFGSRSFGALFAKGIYFSISTGELRGSYQISDDRVVCDEFPTARAYCRYLLQKS